MNNPLDSQPNLYYFISYCRQEVTFVDNFSHELEKRGIRNWVDFRKLVPGRPWQPQLDDGVNNAAAILLIVSKASMASAPVKDEWTKSLAAGKRIVLIIFEPCKLEPELAGLEWVDFTRNFKRGIKQLTALLAQPAQKVTTQPPQKGKRSPGAAKWFGFLSFLATLLALVGAGLTLSTINDVMMQEIQAFSYGAPPNEWRSLIMETVIISLILLWLPAIWNFLQIPFRVGNRSYNAGQLRGSLNGLFFANVILLVIPISLQVPEMWLGLDLQTIYGNVMYWNLPVMLVIFVICFFLYRILVSKSMYRWAGPNGAIIRVPRPNLKEHDKKHTPMRVAIEAAPQDMIYLRQLKYALTKAGHTYTENVEEADVVLPLLSVYKNSSECDPEKTRVIPVLLQSCNVDPRLSQVQWVDLRYGKASMKALSALLDEPDELMRTLGVLPIRTTILPAGVRRVTGLLSLILIISAAFALLDLSLLGTYQGFTGLDIALALLIPPAIYLLRRFLLNRKLKYFPFRTYWSVLVFAILLGIMASYAGWSPAEFTVPLVWLVPLLMLSTEVRMWVPAE